jgi:hypothetical protein
MGAPLLPAAGRIARSHAFNYRLYFWLMTHFFFDRKDNGELACELEQSIDPRTCHKSANKIMHLFAFANGTKNRLYDCNSLLCCAAW